MIAASIFGDEVDDALQLFDWACPVRLRRCAHQVVRDDPVDASEDRPLIVHSRMATFPELEPKVATG